MYFHCTECKNRMSYSKKLKSMWPCCKKIKCEKCLERYKITSFSKGIISMLYVAPILFLRETYNAIGGYVLYAYILWILFILIISPLITIYEIYD